MSPNDAIVQLTSMASEYANKYKAIQLAITLLQGTYAGQLSDLTDAKATIATNTTYISKLTDQLNSNNIVPVQP